MSHTPLFEDHPLKMNLDKLDFLVKNIDRFRSSLGLNIKTHGVEVQQTCEDGQIFLFNHFARFETIIPPYILHKETGAYTRSIAYKGLFSGQGLLDKTLREVGAVPNDLPGLLPFLAAEILRGRKVVIFPEGGMIKDRRIIDDAGELGIFSRTDNTFRKHHRGAAVLALMLELFKRRILHVFEKGQESRIDHWQEALGLPTREALLTAASKPTMIVPSAITFYPLHIDENALSKGLSFFMKNPSMQMIEEILIETNILLKKTDMDIRFGTPISATHSWHWWENVLLSRYFNNIHSLEEFFSLRESADRWTEKLLVRMMGKETNRIRDAYMKGIYENIMVNLAHLASALILKLHGRGKKELQVEAFHKILYLTLKDLHTTPKVHLHRSLLWPDRYMGLLDGHSPDLERFIKTCVQTNLIKEEEGTYFFLNTLTEEVDYHQVRLHNPVRVSANEIAHCKEVQNALDEAINKVLQPTQPAGVLNHILAQNLFDDELRAYEWNKHHYNQEKYAEINTPEKVLHVDAGRPSLFVAESVAQGGQKVPANKRMGVLMVHGFMSTPASLGNYPERLYKKGYTVLNMRLPGHGTSPWDVDWRSWRQWYRAVQRNYRILASYVDEVVIIGFSTGGVLSLIFATESPKKLTGLVSVCTPVQVQNWKISFVPFVKQVNKIMDWFPGGKPLQTFTMSGTENTETNYNAMSIHALHELQKAMDELSTNLSKIDLPILLLQGEEDTIVKPSSAQDIYNNIRSVDKELHWFKTKEHNLIGKNIGQTRQLIEAFLLRLQGAKLLEKTDNTTRTNNTRTNNN